MKRFLSIFTAFLLALTLCACGESQPETTELSEETSAAVFAAWRLKDYLEEVLKNPSSLEINSIQGGQGKTMSTFSKWTTAPRMALAA